MSLEENQFKLAVYACLRWRLGSDKAWGFCLNDSSGGGDSPAVFSQGVLLSKITGANVANTLLCLQLWCLGSGPSQKHQLLGGECICLSPSLPIPLTWSNMRVLIRKIGSNIVFSVKSFYIQLANNFIDSGNLSWKQIWKLNTATRVIFFAWEVIRGRILTLENPKKRGKSYWLGVISARQRLKYLTTFSWCPLSFWLWCTAYGRLGVS